MLRHEAGQVRRGTQRAPVDLGDREGGVVGGDDDVGVAGQRDAATEAEALHRRDHGHFAVVHGRERFVAAAVHADERGVRRVGRQLLDVDAGLEAFAFGAQDHDAHIGVATHRAERFGQLEPARNRKRVHRRIVDGDDRDPLLHFRTDHAAEHTSVMVSLWSDTLGAARTPRSPLPGNVDADVAIIGAGYTGLWTAYALLAADPKLRVVICEREHVGFGASGRNGGWCSAFFAGARDAHGSHSWSRRRRSRCSVRCSTRSTRSSASSTKEGIDCDWARGGTLEVATVARAPRAAQGGDGRSSCVRVR